MIDSIRLLIPPQQFKIHKPYDFVPYAQLIYQNEALKSVLNKKENGVYHPRLTLMRRKNLDGISKVMLTIECSLPKLLFGNNLEEFRQKDFSTIANKLHTRLLDMGIEIAQHHLQNAAISSIHYSKNIKLVDGSTPFHYIQKIKNIVTPVRLDNNQTDYRNSGHCFKYHCNSHEVVFYDKIQDFVTAQTISKKRSIDPDNFFDIKRLSKIRTKYKKFELLRMEVRLNTRSKIKHLFAKLKIKSDLTLRKLFRPVIARKVLLHYMHDIEQRSCSLLDLKPLHDKELLTILMLNNLDIKPKQILQYFGLKKALETMTLDELKKILYKQNSSAWKRLLKEIDSLHIPTMEQPFKIIKAQLQTYKPIQFKKL